MILGQLTMGARQTKNAPLLQSSPLRNLFLLKMVESMFFQLILSVICKNYHQMLHFLPKIRGSPLYNTILGSRENPPPILDSAREGSDHLIS